MTATFVRQTVGSGASAANATATITASTTGNNLYAVYHRSGGLATGAVTSVTDSAAQTWTLRASRGAVSGGTNTRVELWYIENSASITSVTFNSGTAQTNAWNIFEFSGMLASSSLDVASPDNSATTSSTTVATPAVTNTVADALVIVAAHFTQTTSTAPAGYTALTNSDDGAVGSGRQAYKIVAATGSQSASWTSLGVARAAGVITAIFKIAATVTPVATIDTESMAETSSSAEFLARTDALSMADSSLPAISSISTDALALADSSAITQGVATVDTLAQSEVSAVTRILTVVDSIALVETSSSVLSVAVNDAAVLAETSSGVVTATGVDALTLADSSSSVQALAVVDTWSAADSSVLVQPQSALDSTTLAEASTLAAAIGYTGFGSTIPSAFGGDPSAVTVATALVTSLSGQSIIGVRVFIDRAVSGDPDLSSTVYVWARDNGTDIRLPGTQLATASIAALNLGWTNVYFASPVSLTPGIPVFIGWWNSGGLYYYTASEFTTALLAPSGAPGLVFPQDNAGTGLAVFNGSYGYGSIGTVPSNQSSSATWYGVDALLSSAGNAFPLTATDSATATDSSVLGTVFSVSDSSALTDVSSSLLMSLVSDALSLVDSSVLVGLFQVINGWAAIEASASGLFVSVVDADVVSETSSLGMVFNVNDASAAADVSTLVAFLTVIGSAATSDISIVLIIAGVSDAGALNETSSGMQVVLVFDATALTEISNAPATIGTVDTTTQAAVSQLAAMLGLSDQSILSEVSAALASLSVSDVLVLGELSVYAASISTVDTVALVDSSILNTGSSVSVFDLFAFLDAGQAIVITNNANVVDAEMLGEVVSAAAMVTVADAESSTEVSTSLQTLLGADTELLAEQSQSALSIQPTEAAFSGEMLDLLAALAVADDAALVDSTLVSAVFWSVTETGDVTDTAVIQAPLLLVDQSMLDETVTSWADVAVFDVTSLVDLSTVTHHSGPAYRDVRVIAVLSGSALGGRVGSSPSTAKMTTVGPSGVVSGSGWAGRFVIRRESGR